MKLADVRHVQLRAGEDKILSCRKHSRGYSSNTKWPACGSGCHEYPAKGNSYLESGLPFYGFLLADGDQRSADQPEQFSAYHQTWNGDSQKTCVPWLSLQRKRYLEKETVNNSEKHKKKRSKEYEWRVRIQRKGRHPCKDKLQKWHRSGAG